MADEERLVILLEAKLNQLEKQMAKASGVTAKAYREMSLGSKKATAQMEADAIRSSLRINQALATTSAKVGAFGSTFAASALAPVAGLLTLTAAVNGTKAALDKYGDVADRATEAGIDSEYFQGLAYGAKLAGVEFDGFSTALTTFAKNSGLAIENKGRMVTALKALNPELLKSIQNAKDQESRLRLAADALNATTDAAQKAALAAALFGDQGVVMAKAFEGGAAALDETVAKARELGLVVDRELISRAEEFGDAWDTAASIINTKVAVALTGLAPGMLWLLDRMVDLTKEAEAFAAALASPRDFFAWLGGGSGAESRLRDVFRSMQDSSNAAPVTYYDADGRLVQQPAPGFDSVGPGLNSKDLESWFNVALKPHTPAAPASDTSTVGGSGEPFDFRAFLDKNYRDSLEGYPPIFDRTTTAAKKTAVAVRDNSDAVTELSQRWQTAEDMAQQFGSTFLSSMRSGQSAVESLIDSLVGLADQAANMLMSAGIQGLFNALSGGLTGGFGSIAGGAAIPMGGFVPGLTGPRLFARGGISNGPAIFGEAGPEAAVPLPDGRSIPVTLHGSESPITMTFHISGSKQDAAEIARVAADTFEARFPSRMRQYQTRGY